MNYQFSPLQEVAFEVSFHPKLKIFDNLANFQEKISVDYPKIAEERPVLTLALGQPDEFFTKRNEKVVFEDALNTKLVRISIGSFNFVDKQYANFEVFSNEILSLWDKFISEVGKPNITRIGLRFINRLSIPADKAIENHVVPYYNRERFSEYQRESVVVEVKLIKGQIHLNIRSGRLPDIEEDGIKLSQYYLDYDCFEQHDGLNTNLKPMLDCYHQSIKEQFFCDVKQSFLEYMKVGHWQ
jgi:uncharacterized protein (TIGR04255 family)